MHTYGSVTDLRVSTLSFLLLHLMYDFRVIKQTQYDWLSQFKLHFLFTL